MVLSAQQETGCKVPAADIFPSLWQRGISTTACQDKCWCKWTGVQGGILQEGGGHAVDQFLLKREAPRKQETIKQPFEGRSL